MPQIGQFTREETGFTGRIHTLKSFLTQAKKIARQKEGLDATCVRSGDQTKVDSPGWEVRMKSLETGNDAALADSSPQGAALLARKVERQNQALDGALRRPPDTGELQRPTPPSRLAGGSR